MLEQADASLVLLMTDVSLAGPMSGVELAHVAMNTIPSSTSSSPRARRCGRRCRTARKFWPKPWAPLDVIREAERMSLAWSQVGEA